MKFWTTLCIGILACVWPCGVITLVDELFHLDSKTQAYGRLGIIRGPSKNSVVCVTSTWPSSRELLVLP